MKVFVEWDHYSKTFWYRDENGTRLTLSRFRELVRPNNVYYSESAHLVTLGEEARRAATRVEERVLNAARK